MKKKVLFITLAIMLVSAMASPKLVLAGENEELKIGTFGYWGGLIDQKPPDDGGEPNQNEVIGTLAIVAAEEVQFEFAVSAGFSSFTGHAFLVFKNTSSSYQTVGKMAVAPNETITFGTWPSANSPDGIYYNVEAHSGGLMLNNIALETTITYGALKKITALMKDSSNDTWSIFKTCVTFARKIWNSMGYIIIEDYVEAGASGGISIDLVHILTGFIKNINDYHTNYSFPNNEKYGYYSGSTFIKNMPALTSYWF